MTLRRVVQPGNPILEPATEHSECHEGDGPSSITVRGRKFDP